MDQSPNNSLKDSHSLTGKTIVFYDGDCGLCQRSIAFLYQADKRHLLLFAPLNGETYKKLYSEEARMDTVRVYRDGKTWEKSRAFLELGPILGGFYRLSFLLNVIPAFIRDFVYDQIAKRRKAFSCLWLPKDERFLN